MKRLRRAQSCGLSFVYVIRGAGYAGSYTLRPIRDAKGSVTGWVAPRSTSTMRSARRGPRTGPAATRTRHERHVHPAWLSATGKWMYVWANPAYARVIGCSSEDVDQFQGRRLEDVLGRGKPSNGIKPAIRARFER